VVVSGNTAYLCDANGIAVLNVANPSAPTYLSNFGQYDVDGAGENCALYQGDLLAFTSGLLNVYNLATPTAPVRLTQNQFYYGNTVFAGTTAYVSTAAYNTDAMNNVITQTGDFYIYDMTSPVAPKLDAQLVQTFLVPGSADTSPRGGLAIFNQDAIVLGTTATAANTSGQALWTTIDISTPTKPVVVSQTTISGASIAVSLAVEGTQALVMGNTAGIENPLPAAGVDFYTGKLTLSLIDFANPLAPKVLANLVTPYQSTGGYALAPLNSGFYAITYGPPLTDPQGPATLAIVDARNPPNLILYPQAAIDGLQGITYANGDLYAVSNAGLTIYSVTLPH
jgi:hypothetical protein